MEHPAAAQMHIQEKTYYQSVGNNPKEGTIYIDCGKDGYVQFYYAIINGEINICFVSKFYSLFSARVAAMMPYEQPKQVSKLDLLDFIRVYKKTFEVFS